MKTKIIYISGNETFEMTEIRAAFEEVRATLGLDKDTILFGVPVDCDTALADVQEDKVVSTDVPEIIPETTIVSEIIPEIDAETVEVTEPVESEIEPVIEISESEEEVTPVVPILSVLGGTDPEFAITDVVANEPVDETEDIVKESADVVETVITDVSVAEEEPILMDDITEDEPVVITTATVEVEDIVDDSTPETPMEKTLEQLLESMTPLREDVVPEQDVISENVSENTDVLPPEDTDATLAQLASEFVQNEDKFPLSTKTETSGKIGKLKNILPFKKAKRDDSGLMGDLFGWAGIAANDEDFSIPGFFTQAASKK